MDSDTGSSVTLILYSIDKHWYKEPLLNLLAAAAQMSSFTHCELAIGEYVGESGKMANVLRVFNDIQGVELCQRTGVNPQYQYVQIGCSKAAEQAMLTWAKKQIGKPFSTTGMARSVVWPRQTDGSSFFCAELVAACLQVGGLMARDSRPGAATPQSLYKLYRNVGAATANLCFLRRNLGARSDLTSSETFKMHLPLKSNSLVPTAISKSATAIMTQRTLWTDSAQLDVPASITEPRIAKRSTSPPRMSFKPLANKNDPLFTSVRGLTDKRLTLSLSSLSFYKN